MSRRTRLVTRILVGVLAISAVAALLSAAFLLFVQYRWDVQAIHGRFADIRASYANSLSNSLWVANDHLLHIELAGIYRLPDIRFVAIRDRDSGPDIVIGSKPKGETLTERVPLTYRYEGRNLHLGDLVVVAGLGGIYGGLLRQGELILASQTLQMLVLALVIVFLVHRLVIRHLGAIAAVARTTTIGTLGMPVVLARALRDKTDELDDVVAATNTMRRSLAKSYEEISRVNRELERDIERRTAVEAALIDSETRLRIVIDNAPFFIAELEPDGRVVLVNREGQPPFGLEGMMVEVGKTCPRVAEIPQFAALVTAAVEGTVGAIDIEYADRVFHAQALPLAVPGGPRHALVIVQDRTETHRALTEIRRLNDDLEQRVRQRTAELQMVNSELEAFAYSVSHDLRAPLRRIDGFSRILVEDHGGRLDEDARHYLDRIRAGSQTMGQTIDALLGLSRSARSDMVRTDVDLSAIASRIAAELSARSPARRIDWRIEPGMQVEGDSRLLTAALENLLTNAWKYTGRTDRAEIAFGTETMDGERVFFVTDNGAGFDMEYAESLFKPFTRLHDAEEFEGTGIGLALVDRIIRRHGGRIWADGSPGHGATFRFTL